MADPVKNFAKVTVSTGYDSSAVEIVLESGHGAKLPDPSVDGAFNLTWWDSTLYPDPSDDPNVEIVRCTAIDTDTLTITRAQEGTSATDKNTADSTYKIILAMTKKMKDDLEAAGAGIWQHIGTVSVVSGKLEKLDIPSGFTIFRVTLILKAVSGTDLALRLNSDTGNNYGYQNLKGSGSTVSALRQSGGANHAKIGKIETDEYSICTLFIQNRISSDEKTFLATMGAGDYDAVQVTSGEWKNTVDEIDAIKIFTNYGDTLATGSKMIIEGTTE
jgi:hypothetical protein